jgi:hypothetical protein
LKASQIQIDKNLSFLFKSSPGFGKTLAAASFAVEGEVYIAYFDKKKPIELLTYFTEKRFGSLAKKILDNIEYDVYGAHNAHEYLNKVIKFSQDCRYFAFVTDSVTNLTSAAVNWSMGFRDPKKGKKDKLNNEAPLMIPDFDEYKVETSLVSQALDISKTLPCHVIWTAHPLPSIKIEGSGNSIKVTKTNPIVTYGSKVAGMIPGNFTEIYHFSKTTDFASGSSKLKYTVNTEAIGDEYAKSPLLADYVKEFDITDKLFYTVWKDLVDKSRGMSDESIAREAADKAKIADMSNPFANQPSETKWKV